MAALRTIEISAPLVRLYFNGGGDDRRVWTVDLGRSSLAWKVRRVEWQKSIGETRAGLHRDRDGDFQDEQQPRVWLEFRWAILRIESDVAILFHDHEWRVPRTGNGAGDQSGG